jgi:hypothetical protein
LRRALARLQYDDRLVHPASIEGTAE